MTKTHPLNSNFAWFSTPKWYSHIHCLVLKNNPNYVNFITRMISNFKYKCPPRDLFNKHQTFSCPMWNVLHYCYEAELKHVFFSFKNKWFPALDIHIQALICFYLQIVWWINPLELTNTSFWMRKAPILYFLISNLDLHRYLHQLIPSYHFSRSTVLICWWLAFKQDQELEKIRPIWCFFPVNFSICNSVDITSSCKQSRDHVQFLQLQEFARN